MNHQEQTNKSRYLMTSMQLIGNYFSYCIASAMLWSVIQVVKVLSHLSGGEESHFPYPQTGGGNSFHNDSNIKMF